MSSVWVVTEGDYEDNHIVGIFSTEEKAWKFYRKYTENVDSQLYSHYFEPEKYELDPVTAPKFYKVQIYNWDKEWKSRIVGVSNSESDSHVYKNNEFNYYITVPYNKNRKTVINSALSYFFKYLAENEI